MRMNIKDFSLDKTLSAGQTFSWFKSDGKWVRLVGYPIVVTEVDSSTLEIEGAGEREVRRLLGLNDNIERINNEINKDDFISEAIKKSTGLRVVEDGVWPSTLSFVLSIQSNINLIKKRIQALSRIYGERIEVNGKEMYTFPSPRGISDRPGLLSEAKLGFRSKFVLAAAKHFSETNMGGEMGEEEIVKHLLSIHGVGPKVLDCVMLYGLHRLSYFPIDVWIERALKEKYSNLIGSLKSYKKINEKMREYFGEFAGYAQLYIYDSFRRKPTS
ncbi:MAG: DNA-3-methyladenine glycosylase family protein [Candidatus Acidifodinimicrobium sp.]